MGHDAAGLIIDNNAPTISCLQNFVKLANDIPYSCLAAVTQQLKQYLWREVYLDADFQYMRFFWFCLYENRGLAKTSCDTYYPTFS